MMLALVIYALSSYLEYDIGGTFYFMNNEIVIMLPVLPKVVCLIIFGMFFVDWLGLLSDRFPTIVEGVKDAFKGKMKLDSVNKYYGGEK